MYNNVFNFMNEKELIYKYQFGFRQKHSTQQAIITLVDKITKSLDSGDIVIGVFFEKYGHLTLAKVNMQTIINLYYSIVSPTSFIVMMYGGMPITYTLIH